MKAITDPSISPEEFSALYKQHRERFTHVAYSFVRDEAIAEDIVSDSFMAFLESHDKLSPGSNHLAYIMTIVKNRCLNWLKQQKIHSDINRRLQSRQQRLILNSIRSLELCDPHELFENEVSDIVAQELDRMSELRRKIFLANKFENKTCRVISEEFHITYRMANYELNRAVAALVRALRDYLPVLLALLVGSNR
ncbi:MAG: sigma-70 family RNA polymerase sigma factor [Rikenellaceae bacterium]|nr:sigma-70 family RNA polymerase sigma factor [Rikenellaceae bacterium]